MKRSAKLFIMLGILAILIVGAVIQKQFFPPEQGGDTENGSTVVYAANDVVSENVTALSYEKEGVVLSFRKEGEEWVLDEENAPNIDTEQISSMVSAISEPTGTNRMENVPKDKLTSYGLNEPSLRVTVSEGEKERTFLFGNYNKTAKEYYFCNEGETSLVFTVESSSYEAFDYSLEDLIIHDKLPEIAAESVTGFSLESDEGITVLSSIKTPTDENEDGYIYFARISHNGVTEDFSYADFYKCAEAVSEWNIDEFVTADASEGSKYGFDSPITLTVNYTERVEIEEEGASGGYIDRDKSYTLILGKADEDGFFYVKTSKNSRLIYKLSSPILSESFK